MAIRPLRHLPACQRRLPRHADSRASVHIDPDLSVAPTYGGQNGPQVKQWYDNRRRLIRSAVQGFVASGTAPWINRDYVYLADDLNKVSLPYFDGGTVQYVQVDHDLLGRPTSESHPDGGRITWSYSGLNTTVTARRTASSADDQITVLGRDEVEQTVSVKDALGKITTLAYDAAGNLAGVTDPSGNTIQYQYDERDRLTDMLDADLGHWVYKYDALSELVKQTDANNLDTLFGYDKVGRLTSRSSSDHSLQWTYDAYAKDPCPYGAGRLCQVSSDNKFVRTFTYDSAGRTVSTKAKIGDDYITSLTYNANGRPDVLTYPGGFKLKHDYTSLGYLLDVKDASRSPVVTYWKATQMDAAGHVTGQTYGNGVATSFAYNPTQGKATSSNASTTQTLSNTYDYLGNMLTQRQENTNLSQTFGYDKLNRLISEDRKNDSWSDHKTTTWDFDIDKAGSPGNTGSFKSLLFSDLAEVDLTYFYNLQGASSIRPHAVGRITGTISGVSNPSYTYDADGNMKSGAGRTIAWMSFNQPISVSEGSNQLQWLYDENLERIQETWSTSGTVQRTTAYVNPAAGQGLFYESEKTRVAGAPDTVKQRHYISVGGVPIAIATYDGTSWSTRYIHTDALGSFTALSDEGGSVLTRLAYEPYGKRRTSSGASDPAGTLTSSYTRRGFTGHEMLDEVGLIHMNGRLFDPGLGRFISADPVMHDPSDIQSVNRYSYVRNSPATFVDPSGFNPLNRLNQSADLPGPKHNGFGFAVVNPDGSDNSFVMAGYFSWQNEGAGGTDVVGLAKFAQAAEAIAPARSPTVGATRRVSARSDATKGESSP